MKISESQIDQTAQSKINRACQLAKKYLKKKSNVSDDVLEQKFTLSNIKKLADNMSAPNGESQGETQPSLQQFVLSVILAYYSLLSIPSQEVPKVAGVIENLDSLLENLETAFNRPLEPKNIFDLNKSIACLNLNITSLQNSDKQLSYFPLRATSEAYQQAKCYIDTHASSLDKFLVKSASVRMVSNRLAMAFQELQKKTDRSRPSDDETSQAETPHGSPLDPSEAGEAHSNNGNSDNIALPEASVLPNTTYGLSIDEMNLLQVRLRYHILSNQRAKIPHDNQEICQWLDDDLDMECSQRLQKLQYPNLFQFLLNIFKRLLNRLIGLSCFDPSRIIAVLKAIVKKVKEFMQTTNATERLSSEHDAERQAFIGRSR